MSPRRNWDSPNPSLASECAPPPRTGGHTRLRVRGWESPNSDDWRKNSASSVLRKNKVQILIFGHFNIFFLLTKETQLTARVTPHLEFGEIPPQKIV